MPSRVIGITFYPNSRVPSFQSRTVARCLCMICTRSIDCLNFRIIFDSNYWLMRISGLILVLTLLGWQSVAQHAKNTLALSVSGDDRISVVRSSVRLAEWHERSFWPLYEQYLSDATDAYSSSYRSLQGLATTDSDGNAAEAFEHGWNLLTYRNEALEVKKKYYKEVGAVLNGVVALQFLQTETMMDMLQSAQIYGETDWKNFHFSPATLPPDQAKAGKHNIIEAALSIPASKRTAFWDVYERYEQECDDLLGEHYNVYSLFAGEASDFTPALAKRLGYDLLHITERELRLKERYFLEMNEAVGSMLAARFLAWEDYYSLVAKMHAWTDEP